MDIFIRRLPQSVTRLDLIEYLRNPLKPRWSWIHVFPGGRLKGCEIFKVVDREAETVEYHGIAHVEPATAAVTAIQRLDGTPLKQKRMEVRKFFRRSRSRDRRHEVSGLLSGGTPDRRLKDRRRPNLSVTPLHAGSTRLEVSTPLPHV